MKGTVTRDFKVLTEKISPENIAVMAELIAMRETKALIGFMGYHAEKAHKKLCKDIFCKDTPGYMLSDSYDLVQNVALFLCGHYHENVVQEIQADAEIPKSRRSKRERRNQLHGKN